MKEAPAEINGGRVVRWSWIDNRHRHTGNCRQIVNQEVQGAAAGLAICKFEGERAFYLFGCDNEWQVVSDTWHATFEEALAQAEFEYEGVSATWDKP